MEKTTEIAMLEPPAQPVTSLTPGEAKAILDNPYGLRLLMDHADLQYTMASSMLEPGEVGPWPTPRWLALCEQGRAIIAQDPEIWDANIKQAFGFDEPGDAR